MSRRRPKTLYEKELEEQKLYEMQSQNYKKYEGDIRRGDIFYFDKSCVTGVEQQGGRPGVIVSNDACNNSSDFLLVCYLTTQPKTKLPTHVPVVCEQKSICLCEQIHTLSKEKMRKFCCTATPDEMKEIDKALMITLGIDLNKVSQDEYENVISRITILENSLKEEREENKRLRIILKDANEEIELLQSEIKERIEHGSKLVNEIQTLKNKNTNVDSNNIENNPEYIKICAERNVYKELYMDLIKAKI